MADITRYLNMIEVQHQGRTRYSATLSGLLTRVDSATQVFNLMPAAFDIESAVGAQLDAVGDLVGVSRAFPYISGTEPAEMDDAMYRKVILMRIAANTWDGTLASFKTIWDDIFGESGITARYHDNQDMTVTVTLSGDISTDFERLIYTGVVFPKAMGVTYSYVISGQGDRTASTSSNTYAAAPVTYIESNITVI